MILKSRLFTNSLVLFLLSLSQPLMLSSANAEGAAVSNEKVPQSSEVTAKESKDARMDSIRGEGYSKEAQTLYDTVAALTKAAQDAKAEGADVLGLNNGKIADLHEAATYYNRFHSACVKAQGAASWWCREKTSPHLQDSLNEVNTLMGFAKGMAVNDACSTFAKAMKVTQGGLTLYTSSCGAARATCESACETVKTNLDRIKKANGSYFFCSPGATEASIAACQRLEAAVKGLAFDANVVKFAQMDAEVRKENSETDGKSIGTKYYACTYDYKKLLLSAGMGLLSVVDSIRQGQQCDDETNGTGVAGAQADKCDDPANASLAECICKFNPRSVGCSNAYQKPGEMAAAGVSASSGGDRGVASSRGALNLDGSKMPGLDNVENKSGGDSSGGVGAPTGGGGGAGLGGGGSGGGSARGAATGEAQKSGLNANILGSGGGGGGGGRWGSSGGVADEKYRPYLPGGAKDPNKGMAGQQSWKNEVTGQGGKSNWDKVKDRYRDNTTTLIGN